MTTSHIVTGYSMNESKVFQFQRNTQKKGNDPMGPTFRRTRKGSEELVLRQHGLSEEQRKILLYASGNRSMDDLARLVPEVEESPDILMAMEELGFVELHDPEIGQPGNYQTSQQKSNVGQSAQPSTAQPSGANHAGSTDITQMKREVISDLSSILGKESGTAVEKIDGLKSREELVSLLPRLGELIKLYAGSRMAEDFLARHTSK